MACLEVETFGHSTSYSTDGQRGAAGVLIWAWPKLSHATGQ